MPREITHERRLVGCTVVSAEFFAAAVVLGAQLEAVLVQLPPDFRPSEWESLAAFIPTLPSGPRIALEVRDPAWFEPATYRELSALLREHNVALAVSDGTFVERNLMLAALRSPTATFCYVRWMGRRDAVTRFDRVSIDRRTEIERWSELLQFAALSLERICGYANNHYMGHSPATVRALYSALGIERKPPSTSIQTELFPVRTELEEH